MTKNIDHVDHLLSAWFEGDLGEADRRAVDAHLRQCLRCAALVRDIEGIRHDAANLPPLAPSRDLWAGIAARIEAPVIELPTRQAARVPARRTWQMAAAAVLLMAASSGVTYVLTKRSVDGDAPAMVATTDSQMTPTTVSDVPGVVTPPRRAPRSPNAPPVLVSEPRPAELAFNSEITRLRSILDQRRASLDPATIAVVEQSLKAIDLAISDARTALAADAASPFLNDQLNRALEKKVSVLRRVALMPVGAS